MAPPKEYRAMVEKIILDGKHGPYAVASVEGLGSVTFSLVLPVWEEEVPEPGEYVVLSRVRKKPSGWRAHCGRFLQPSD
jgi:hypothetical protein